MYQPAVHWNPKQNRLKEILRKPDFFGEAIGLCLELHAFVHQSGVSNSTERTLGDAVCENLREIDYCHMPTKKDVTIAWNLWHIARIEDITMNFCGRRRTGAKRRLAGQAGNRDHRHGQRHDGR